MLCASTREVIEKLTDYETVHGVGAISGVSVYLSGDRTNEFSFRIRNMPYSDRGNAEFEETTIPISSIEDSELFDKCVEHSYFVVENEKGEYFGYDRYTGGYPFWNKYIESSEKFKTYQGAYHFLYEDEYTQRMFRKEFAKCKIKKISVNISISDC